jgi:hypothetical protein
MLKPPAHIAVIVLLSFLGGGLMLKRDLRIGTALIACGLWAMLANRRKGRDEP